MGGVRVTPSHHFYLGFLFYVCFFIRMNNFQVFFSKTIKKLFFYETCIVLCFVSIYRCALTVGITCCAPYVLLCFFQNKKKKKERKKETCFSYSRCSRPSSALGNFGKAES